MHVRTSLLIRPRVGTLQVNLNKMCPFWRVSSHCGLRDCAVKPCSTVSSSSHLSAVNKSSLFTSPDKNSVYSQNEVPEGMRASYHSKVSPAGSVYGKRTLAISPRGEGIQTSWKWRLFCALCSSTIKKYKFRPKCSNTYFHVYYNTFLENSEEA